MIDVDDKTTWADVLNGTRMNEIVKAKRRPCESDEAIEHRVCAAPDVFKQTILTDDIIDRLIGSGTQILLTEDLRDDVNEFLYGNMYYDVIEGYASYFKIDKNTPPPSPKGILGAVGMRCCYEEKSVVRAAWHHKILNNMSNVLFDCPDDLDPKKNTDVQDFLKGMQNAMIANIEEKINNYKDGQRSRELRCDDFLPLCAFLNKPNVNAYFLEHLILANETLLTDFQNSQRTQKWLNGFQETDGDLLENIPDYQRLFKPNQEEPAPSSFGSPYTPYAL